MNQRIREKVELIREIPMYLVSILLLSAGEAIIFYKIDISQYRSSSGIFGMVNLFFSILSFFYNLLGTFGVGLFIFCIGYLFCQFCGINILNNSRLVNMNNEKAKKKYKILNLVVALIISISLMPSVSRVLSEMQEIIYRR